MSVWSEWVIVTASVPCCVSVVRVGHCDSECAMLCQCGPGSVHRLQFSFRRGSLPPYIPLEHVACVGGCDTSLNEALDISRTPSTLSSFNNSTAGHLSYQLHSHARAHCLTAIVIVDCVPHAVDSGSCWSLLPTLLWLDTLPYVNQGITRWNVSFR